MSGTVSANAVHLEGLFHLGALAIAVTAAYVGLDRVKMESDEFAVGLTKFRDGARKFLEDEFDIRWEHYSIVQHSVKVRAVIVLCYIAFANTQTSVWSWPFHIVYRQFKLPLYRYFFDRTDIKIMSVLCFSSLASLLYLVFLQVFEFNLAEWTRYSIDGAHFSVTKELYFAYAVMIILAFVSVSVSSKLKLAFLERKLQQLYLQACAQRQRIGSEVENRVMQFRSISKPPK